MSDKIKYYKRWNGSSFDKIFFKTKWASILDSPTTLSGYGITDAKIENGTITLGSNSITPVTLDANGKVPSSQLPSYVDDVLEYSAFDSLPAPGETGKIYVTTDNNKTYRWSGSAFVEISPSLALGTTSSTAFRGDYGNTAYNHASLSGNVGAKTSGLYKITTDKYGHVTDVENVAKSDITALGIPGSDTNTWRGIQDNLTSSTNTTESLSAKQGYLLANGSARDNTKLPLAGGTLTGILDLKSVPLRFLNSNDSEIGSIETRQDSAHSNQYRPHFTYSDAVSDFIALRSDIPTNYLPLSGGTLTGKLQVNAPIFGYNYTNGNSKAAFVFDKNGSNYTGIGSHNIEDTIWFGAVSNTTDGTWDDSYKQKWNFNGTILEDGTSLADKYAAKSHTHNYLSSVSWGDIDNKPSSFPPSSHTHSYLPLTGGAVSGMITRDAGGSWISARDNVIIKTTRTSASGSDWHPIIGAKTSDGFWSLGSVGGETLCLSYDTDTDYNNSSNNSSVINFPPAGSSGTLALTSQIPQIPSSLPASDVYSWAKASTKPSYSALDISYGSNSNVSDALDELRTAGYITGINSTMVTDALGYTPGTSNFTGYTSSNKLSTSYIQNDAGWSSFSGYSSSNKLSTSYIQNDAGWTSNAGTVTSVSVKMNGSVKGTVSSSGTIDLGTVITSHQSLSGCVQTADMSTAYLKPFLQDEFAPYGYKPSIVSANYQSNPSSGVNNGQLQFVVCTQAQYNGYTKRANTLYIIT